METMALFPEQGLSVSWMAFLVGNIREALACLATTGVTEYSAYAVLLIIFCFTLSVMVMAMAQKKPPIEL